MGLPLCCLTPSATCRRPQRTRARIPPRLRRRGCARVVAQMRVRRGVCAALRSVRSARSSGRSVGRSAPSVGSSRRSVGKNAPSAGSSERSVGKNAPSAGSSRRSVGRNAPSVGSSGRSAGGGAPSAGGGRLSVGGGDRSAAPVPEIGSSEPSSDFPRSRWRLRIGTGRPVLSQPPLPRDASRRSVPLPRLGLSTDLISISRLIFHSAPIPRPLPPLRGKGSPQLGRLRIS